MPLRLVINLQEMPVGVAELKRRAVAEFAFDPANARRVRLFSALTRRSSARGLRARNAAWPRPEVFASVSFRLWRS